MNRSIAFQNLGSLDPLSRYRDRGLGQIRQSVFCGPMPSHRCTVFELSLLHDPMINASHFLMRTSLRDRLSGDVIATRCDDCHALPLSIGFDEREIYVREMCQMIAPLVLAHGLHLSHLSQVIQTMNASWDILGVFKDLEDLDAVFLRRTDLVKESAEKGM